jgi:hypothetical protein
LAGKDVGPPIIHFGPPDGVVFFGPGFAELKRSPRERPQLPLFGVTGWETGQAHRGGFGE